MTESKLLIEETRKSLQALAKIEAFYDRTMTGVDLQDPSEEKGVVIAEVLAKYYTCVETAFLRISQFFENNLSRERWHADLLDKMTLAIDGVRAAVIRDETRDILLEILKFRHFSRYYYDMSYDPDRLAYLTKKLTQVRPMVREDMEGFIDFLQQLEAAGAGDGE